MLIRELDASDDTAIVEALYEDAADYWNLDRPQHTPAEVADEFFTDAPPNCDPAQSHRLGLFLSDHLAGVAELSFGFPRPGDAYLGLMIFATWARGQGHGATLLRHIEHLARSRGCHEIFLGVLSSNPKGRAFWMREGFTDTGISRISAETGNNLHRLCKAL